MVAVLAITGFVLIFLEFFLPSGIMAIGGGILLVSSLLLLLIKQPAFSVLAAYVGILGIALLIIIRMALCKVKKGSSCLANNPEEFQACISPREMIGKAALASCELNPAGYVQIEDRAFAALSKSGHIEKGAKVLIVGGEGSSLIVVREL